MNFLATSVLSRRVFTNGLALSLCILLLASSSHAQRRIADNLTSKVDSPAPEASVTPIAFDGQNITCANLNAIPDSQYGGAFTRIVDNDSLKLDFNSPNGMFQFRSYTSPQGQVVLTGNQPTPIRSVNISSSGSSVFSFSSQVQILAVNVKVGNTSYIYSYAYPSSPITYSDINLITGDHRGISHITFCYGLSVAPSAAPASLSGRVVDSNGRGIGGSSVSILDPESGARMSARSNPFGYYTFSSIPAGQLYIISISDKRYTFANDTRSLTLNEDLADMDFIANPL